MLSQCTFNLQSKLKITQRHNKSKLEDIKNEGPNCLEQNIIMPLQIKIVK